MHHLRSNQDFTLKFLNLDNSPLTLQVYSDASVASNHDLSFFLAYSIFLKDQSNICHPLYWISYKAKRVNCSVSGREIMALLMPSTWHMWSRMIYNTFQNRTLPLICWQTVLHCLMSGRKPKVLRKKDVTLTCKQFKIRIKSEVKDVAYISSEYNISDALPKVKKQSILVEAIEKSMWDHPIQQWTIRYSGTDLVVKERKY